MMWNYDEFFVDDEYLIEGMHVNGSSFGIDNPLLLI
jgi:hypothetical protein